MNTNNLEVEKPKAWCYKVFPGHSDPDPMILEEWDSKGVSEYGLLKGRRIEKWPEDMTFFATGAHHEDYLFPSVVSWIIVSDKVRKALEGCGISDFQLLPVRAIHKESGRDLGPHWVLNPLHAAEAVDVERTQWLNPEKDKREYPHINILQPVLREEVVRDLDVFLLKVREGISVTVYVSERVKACLERAQATGFKFTPVPAF